MSEHDLREGSKPKMDDKVLRIKDRYERVHKRLLAMVVVLRGKCSDGEWVEMEKTFELKLKEQEAAEVKLGKMREAGELLYAVMLLMRCSAELQEPPTADECKKMGDAMQKWAALAE